MHIRYGLTLEDLIAFSQYHYENSSRVRRATIKVRVIFALFAVGATAWMSHELHNNVPFIAGGVATAVLLATYRLRFRGRIARAVSRAYGEGRNNGLLGAHSLTVTPEGVRDQTDYGERTIKWKGIEQLAGNDQYLFIYFTAAGALIIPRNSVTEGSFDALLHELKTRWHGPFDNARLTT